jgi:RNA polymerase sigma-70 factor (ECF subfamily)
LTDEQRRSGAFSDVTDRDLAVEEVERLYDRHGRVLLPYACAFVPDRASAEDVVHHVFLRLLRGGIQIEGSPVPYLCRAVRNVALNQRRNRARETSLEEDGHDVNVAGGWLESPVGLHEAGIAIQTALRTLPREQREVIVLRVWGQLSFKETAEAVGVTVNTAASRYRYGLAKLRTQLAPLSEGTR